MLRPRVGSEVLGKGIVALGPGARPVEERAEVSRPPAPHGIPWEREAHRVSGDLKAAGILHETIGGVEVSEPPVVLARCEHLKVAPIAEQIDAHSLDLVGKEQPVPGGGSRRHRVVPAVLRLQVVGVLRPQAVGVTVTLTIFA
jgi:hypothetical protein